MTAADWTPRDGQAADITIRAKADICPAGTSFYFEAYDEDGDRVPVYVMQSQVLDAKPAPVELPTGFGARITATVQLDGGDPVPGIRLALVPLHQHDPDPWVIHPDDMDALGRRRWVAPREMSDVVVLDPGEVTR